MKRIGNFLKSILPILLVLILQILVTLVVGTISAIASGGSASEVIAQIAGTINGSSTGSASSDVINFTYGVVAFIIFFLWYRHAFLIPNRDKKRADVPRGFSFHTIIAILFLGIGLYYITSLLVDMLSALWPQLLTNYNAMMADDGFTAPSVLLILYSIILAPLVEELVFRGLTFRFARRAMSFWPANIWQALLFGLLHFNLLQGIYAFVMGLFLGFVCHRGRGVKYSVCVHIVFNVVGLFFSGLVGITLELNYAIAMICGAALTVFAVWLFYTDFTPADEARPRRRERSSRR